ncbi:MAG: VCBS repeat-containing protein [Bacteroidia bacterium]|nr:VCBS repeat-containing protein [Bacteroidia bacterium]
MKRSIQVTIWALLLGSLSLGFIFTTPQFSFPNLTKGPVFEKIPASESGITFNNRVIADVATKENLFDFDFFYNGAGLGIADLNNDGLQDIFFAANQKDNALYLNRGKLKFEDISTSAGINDNKSWSNGVSFADVNQDGFLDIYVCQGGPKGDVNNGIERRNLLYINQGDMTFVEQALEYGLADEGISTQSVFFDFDKDGDLDCFVGNENWLFGTDPVSFKRLLEQRPELLRKSSSHLYRNDGGKFTDITKEAGLLRGSYALGVIASDLNQDGWIDLYISNDYYVPDFVFINQQDGTFKDENKDRLNHSSFYGMGVDIADLNNDGHQEIFVLDMASSDHFRSKTLMRSMSVDNFRLLVDELDLPYQYMFNSLQLNLGNGKYQNINHFAGTAKTDWSWAGLMADYDNDGYKDIYVTNGYRRYALDNDFQSKVYQAKVNYNGDVPLSIKKELYQQMPTEKLSNFLYRNDHKLHFEDVAKDWGVSDPAYSNGAAYADLDNDGDLELVVNNIDGQAFLYKNISREKKHGNFLSVETHAEAKNSEPFARVYAKVKGQTLVVETNRVRGYLSAVPPIAHFGLGNARLIDTLRIEWPSGKFEERYRVKANSKITFSEAEARQPEGRADYAASGRMEKTKLSEIGLNFKHRENAYDDFAKEILLPYGQSTLGPYMSKADVNGDKLDDLYIGGAMGQSAALYLQGAEGFEMSDQGSFAQDAHFEDMESLFEDFDGDGDLDLFVVSGGNAEEASSEAYADRLYLNDGKGNFKRSLGHDFDEEKYSGKALAAIDFDKDGDMDIVVGNRINPQRYPQAAPSKLYKNEGGKFVDASLEIAPMLSDLGIINQVLATDFDGDGWEDLILAGEWTAIHLLKNNKGSFVNISENTELAAQKGWWFSITETDVNKDGKPDYLIGNVGLNSKFKTSHEKPFKVFANDFDSNGTLDIVLSYKNEAEGDYLPVRGRECSSQQMPFVAEKFPTYNAFAKATLDDIYGDELKDAFEYEVTTFASIILVNQGGGKFKIQQLPKEAQLFPIFSSEKLDYNKDGYEDLMLTGNIYNTEVETPRLDAGSGLILLSDQSGNYTSVSPEKSGLHIDGNAKDLIKVQMLNGETHFIVSRNNSSLQGFKLK